MYTNPQIGGNRQRDLLASAEEQRRTQRFPPRPSTARQAEAPDRGPGRVLRAMARLRAVIPRPARHITDAEAAGGSRS